MIYLSNGVHGWSLRALSRGGLPVLAQILIFLAKVTTLLPDLLDPLKTLSSILVENRQSSTKVDDKGDRQRPGEVLLHRDLA
jgi:hypothetical protein